MAQTYVPVARYRSSSVTNGGTTEQDIYNHRVESRTVTDTKNLVDTKNLAETQQADIGANVKFIIRLPNRAPIPIPPTQPQNPYTT
jgi:hypothetical protein